jgi:sulfite reductase alpha subunit-like flavoprotein
MQIDIIYASRSGTSEQLAQQLQQEIQNNTDKEVTIHNIEDWFQEDESFEQASSSSNHLLLFIPSTSQNGSAPDSATDFYEYMKDKCEEDEDIEHTYSIHYSIFGNGDSRYGETYQLFSRQVKKAMSKLSNVPPVIQCMEGDAADEDGMTQVFDQWTKHVVEYINKQ